MSYRFAIVQLFDNVFGICNKKNSLQDARVPKRYSNLHKPVILIIKIQDTQNLPLRHTKPTIKGAVLYKSSN